MASRSRSPIFKVKVSPYGFERSHTFVTPLARITICHVSFPTKYSIRLFEYCASLIVRILKSTKVQKPFGYMENSNN